MFPTVVTLSGIESYWNKHNQSIFDDIVLPEGVNKDILVPFIISRSGDFSVLDIDPDYLKNKTTLWFESHLDSFTKWFNAITTEYDPIFNHWQREIETHEENDAGVVNRTNTTTSNNTSRSSSNSEVVDSISAENVSSFSNKEKSESENSDSATSNSNVNTSGSDYDTRKNNGGYEKLIEGRTGNIQSIIESELRLRENNNIYDMIATLYISDFCIPIY